MAEESMVDEMADVGTGVSDQLSCTSVLAAIFFLPIMVLLIKLTVGA